MLRTLYIVWFLVAVASCPTWAQLAHSLRIEIPSDPDEAEAFDVTPLGEQGVLVSIRTGGFMDHTPPKFDFQKYDINLKRIWHATFEQNIAFRSVMTYNTDQFVYYLFREDDTDRFQFFRLHLEDGTFETTEGRLIDQFDVQQFKVMGSQAYVGGYRHGRPVVMAFSFFDNSARVLPGMYVNRMEISSLEVDENRQEVNVLVHSLRRHCKFSLRTYNYDCKLLRTTDFDGAQNSLISGKLLPINEQESLLVGNYSTSCTPYSQGIYVTRLRQGENTDESINSIQYIEFSQLENFFNFLKPQRQQKLLAKAHKKKEEGKDYKFHYRLLVHDLKPTPNGLILVAEVYYPQYRGSTIAYGGFLRNADRYEGFRYTHAFICEFDKQGKLLWDNCFPIKELVSTELTEMVQVSQQGDRIVLAYPNDGEITTEVIQRNKILKETEKFKLQTNAEEDKVTFSAQDNLMAWYGQHFLACGFQKIAPSKNIARQREVFYLNKLTYQENAEQPAKSTSVKARKSDGSER
ncbi:hypothetical protein IC229_08430 [Spirosoma sp. BT702]|uniref:Uncharacterized protein n=1 Tax=Spirosoma profusum TaxID=2771354 RepID=A0A926XV00_9BACT|nr:hypothetical protein [Spirosoma profusum]MBD2700659.1 hypothetical protein [Spirosoma profusum]